jgi:hypothetical protein
MEKSTALQYHKTLGELLGELQQATTPELRAPIIARMYNTLFPMHVVDTHAAQHIEESLAKLKHPDMAVVNAANETIASSLQRFREAIDTHPDEPFVVFGEGDRLFVKPAAADEVASLKARGRLLGENHERYIRAIEATPAVERVFRSVDRSTLGPALSRLGFPDANNLVFFTTRAHPKLGVPAARMPSVTVCTLRGGVPVRVVRERAFA